MTAAAKLPPGNFGLFLQVGVRDGVDQLNAVSEYVAKRWEATLLGVDDYRGFTASIIKDQSGRLHARTPPTIHKCAEMVRSIPDQNRPFMFVNFWYGDWQDLLPHRKHFVEGTVVVGSFPIVKMLGDELDCFFRPVFYTEDDVAVRVSY